MKQISTLLLLALVSGSVWATGNKTEIQIFVDYRGANNYDYKLVSRADQIVSASYLYPELAVTDNAACFKGNPKEAIVLFDKMVRSMNNKDMRDILAWGEVFQDEKQTLKPALRIYAEDEYGVEFVWFERIRECDRWSTPEERRRRP